MMRHATVTLCNAVWRHAAINLMAIALVVAGLGVLGTGPAFAASLWALSRPDDRSTGQLVGGMWREWRAEFLRTNLALLPSACLFVAALLVMPRVHGPALAAAIAAAALAAMFALATLYGVSQVRCGVAHTLGNAARLLTVSPIRLLALLAVGAALVILAIAQPLFGLYGLFSVTARAAIALLGAMHDPARRVLAPEIQRQESLA